MILFTFQEYWWLYASFIGFVFVMLAIDLGIFHKTSHEVSVKEASIWTSVWIALALVFNFILYKYSLWKFTTDERYLSIPGFDPFIQAKNVGIEFLTGFLVEKSLAIDNIFIFAIVFSYFQIQKKYQHRVLFWGILGALVFRAIFVAIGSALMQYEWVIWFFGGLLIITGFKMAIANNEKKDLSTSYLIKLLRKVFNVHDKVENDKFIIRKNKSIYVTPLFLALIFLELTDIVFAIDSVPAIFALTKEPLIVFTSNIFAILGLRSMYFMLSGFMDKFIFIKYGLAAVLVFVGSKMTFLNHLYGGKFPVTWSLFIIAMLLTTAIVVSIMVSNQKLKKTKLIGENK